ncbi:hypothetical protein EG329_001529 [Mollisiaceae sp. DMI_Dod_QoI]|nr:hypothetical protein EG329_001529 [Helotiales sp. DMI_Dod_QoI]
MATPKALKTNATEEDRLRRDESLMKRLRIFHEPETTSDEWPSEFKSTFGSVVTLGSFKFHTYDEIPNDHSTSIWRQATKLRAKQLSDTARRLLKEKPSELTWRLEIEKLVYARFSLRTECKACSGPGRSGRSWRSEIEAVAEVNGPISDDLKARRRSRVPCKCVDVVYSGLNNIFSNRADQVFSYDSHVMNSLQEGQNGKGSRILPERRPDRVYGLCQTTNFEDRLGGTAQRILESASRDAASVLQTTAESGNEELLVQDFLQATPFHQRGEPLLFPFLILEAKSEEGKGHRNCGVQTSLPIWGLLKSQERLSELSCPLEELGGPFVWYISYLGDSWRVSGCHVTITKAKKNYNIRDLWNGRISSPDGALQLLLIVDYIFDWARDIYRPSILCCLETMNEDFDTRMSFAADTDINSTRRTCRLDTWTEAETSADSEEFETSASDNSLLDPWKTHDLFDAHSVVDNNSRVFRHSSIIKTSFQCLYLTRDNMMSFINCLGDSCSKYKRIARTALQALRDGPMTVSQRTLSNIEHEWTGTIRETHHTAPESKMLCAIVHASSISSKTWELSRNLFCLAVDEGALLRIRQYSELEKSTYRLEGIEEIAPHLDPETASSILFHLKNRNMKDTLAFAIAHTVDFWRPISRLSRKKRKLAGYEYEQSVILEPLIRFHYPIKNLVQEIYRRHKPSGLLEPDAPCLRFSALLERLERQSTADHKYSLPLEPSNRLPTLPEDGALLLCSRYRNAKHMCIFVTKDTCDPTILTEVMSVLIETISKQRFFSIDGYSMIGNDGLQYEKGPQVVGPLIPLIKTAAQLWGEGLLHTFNEKHSHDDYPEIYPYDKSIQLALFKGECYLKWQPFSGAPEPEFERRPKKIRRVFETAQHTQHNLARSEDRPTPESDNAEVGALLKKLGPVRFSKAFRSVLENFEKEVVTID